MGSAGHQEDSSVHLAFPMLFPFLPLTLVHALPVQFKKLFSGNWYSGTLPYPLGPSGFHTDHQSPWHNLQDRKI